MVSGGYARLLRAPRQSFFLFQMYLKEEIQAEAVVANLLRAYQSLRGLFDEWAYWSPADARDTEVDFLLERGRERIAIEAKASERLHDDMLKGLRAIEPLPALRRRILVHRGTRHLATKDGIEIWPVEHFSRALADGSL